MISDAKPRSRTHDAVEAQRTAVKAQYWAVLPECSEQARVEASKRADDFNAHAAALMSLESPVAVSAGEVVSDNPETPWRETVAETLANPTQVTVDASTARIDLLRHMQSDVLAIALDASQSIKAGNSLEKMLAHQLALLHSVSMRTMDKALTGKDADRVGTLNAVTRMMDTFQRGLLTIQRLRSGGSQTVTVKHVTVEAGGQAVIGNVKGGGSRAKRSAPGGKRK